MVTFSIPDARFTSFDVKSGRVLFAGSRYTSIPHQICSDLIKAFGSLGFSFITGCASGVDASFRMAMQDSSFRHLSLVACAFRDRQERINFIHSLFVVPDNLPPKVALARRTLWMTSHCNLLVLFPFGYAQGKPSNPMGKGSILAFKSAIYNNKPVFVVSDVIPDDSNLYTIHKSNLFGVVQGFWCLPIKKGEA